MSELKIKSWWISLSSEKKSLLLAAISTVMYVGLNNPIYSAMYGIAIVTTAYLMLCPRGGKWIKEKQWISYIVYSITITLIGTPALAQVGDSTSACTGAGLLSQVTNFVDKVFSTITFGGIGGGSLSNLICQVVGFTVIGLLLSFIGSFGISAYQISYQQQPVSVAIQPLFGFLIFAGSSLMAISIMLGNSTP